MCVGGTPEDDRGEVGQLDVVPPLVAGVSDVDEIRRLLLQLDDKRFGLSDSVAETGLSGLFGQAVQPGVTGRTFAIRVASAAVNTCACSRSRLHRSRRGQPRQRGQQRRAV